MLHACTERTDLDELIGREIVQGEGLSFRYGPLVLAMKQNEELVLENSATLSLLTVAKLRMIAGSLFIEDTNEFIRPGTGFQLTLR